MRWNAGAFLIIKAGAAQDAAAPSSLLGGIMLPALCLIRNQPGRPGSDHRSARSIQVHSCSSTVKFPRRRFEVRLPLLGR